MRDRYFDCGGYGHVLERGEIPTGKMRELGVWTIEPVKQCPKNVICACHGQHVTTVAPHVFFTCPHCAGMNSEFVGSFTPQKSDAFSLHCNKCKRHLWVAFEGYDENEYKKMVRKAMEKKRKV